jgi:predicted ester cyclase
MTSEMMDLVRKLFIDVFQDGKLEVADEILTDDFTFQYPFPGFSPGIEGIKEFTNVFHNAFPGFELEINDLFEGDGGEGKRVAIRWTLRGTHKGNFLGVEETGKYATISAIGIYIRFPTQAKLSVGWLEMDTVRLLQQISIIKPIHHLLPSLRFNGDVSPGESGSHPKGS